MSELFNDNVIDVAEAPDGLNGLKHPSKPIKYPPPPKAKNPPYDPGFE